MGIRPNGYYTLWNMKDGISFATLESIPQHPDDPEGPSNIVYKYLNAYRTDFDIVDRLCEGDSVESVDKQKPIAGIVMSVKDGVVTFEQGYHMDGTKVSTGTYVTTRGLTCFFFKRKPPLCLLLG